MRMDLEQMPDKQTKRLSDFITLRVEPDLKRKFENLGRLGKDAAEVVRIAMRKALEKVPAN